MKPSVSVFLTVRGLAMHCRCWGDPAQPRLFLLHGWMDASASFQFLVDSLNRSWHVVAPDWRGYGLSSRGGGDSYWFPDYFADLDAILARFQPESPVCLVGHSMGGNIASMYAGIRPERVARLVNLEGFGLAGMRAEDAPLRYGRWLSEVRKTSGNRNYASREELAERLRAGNARLTPERADFLAEHLGVPGPAGRVELRADPAHKRVNPILYRIEEVKACWRNVSAPTLWVKGSESKNSSVLRMSVEEYESRKSCFATLTERVIPDAGHMVHHDQPEIIAALIEDFVPHGEL